MDETEAVYQVDVTKNIRETLFVTLCVIFAGRPSVPPAGTR
ncbi:hypothetical protein CCACVL1_26060 [Corchorus capsularis]|uniref:Uncharacterized protein n=1 Tax=Corchorus capsularis TaxID=210143 RepID=A0A1R3GG41_COCAP|nr:hypothetical protein CCACVL1_26060 [Corchorus capsularis]